MTSCNAAENFGSQAGGPVNPLTRSLSALEQTPNESPRLPYRRQVLTEPTAHLLMECEAMLLDNPDGHVAS